MKTQLFRIGSVLSVLLSLLLCSCATAGRKFNHSEARSLSLGGLTPSEAHQKFGKPRVTNTKATKDGTFELFRYVFAQRGFDTVRARALDLEFRNGQLNAFVYGSSFDEDRTSTDVLAVEKIQIGSTTKNEVAQLLRKPDGQARCPSMLGDFKEPCEKAVEVWVWTEWDEIEIGRRNTPARASKIAIAFDSAGKVTDRETTEVAAH